MELFHRILKLAVDGGASDVHIKIATPVIFRINRQLVAIESPYPTEEWINNVVKNIVPSHLGKRLEEDRAIDFSYYEPGTGRFRTNLFQQRGQFCLAMLYLRTLGPSLGGLGLLPSIKKLTKNPRGSASLVGS